MIERQDNTGWIKGLLIAAGFVLMVLGANILHAWFGVGDAMFFVLAAAGLAWMAVDLARTSYGNLRPHH